MTVVGLFQYLPCLMNNLTDLDPLLDDIEAYLKRTGMTGADFGYAVLKDSGFVTTLRRGREVRRKTRQRVLQFIQENPTGFSKPDR